MTDTRTRTRNTRILITEEGTLAPVLLQKAGITPAQVSIIKLVLDVPDLTYGEVLAWLADRQLKVEKVG